MTPSKMSFALFSILCILVIRRSRSQTMPFNETTHDVMFHPENLTRVTSGDTYVVEWFTTLPGASYVSYGVADPYVSSVNGSEGTFDETSLTENITGQGEMAVTATFLGFNTINVTIYDKDNKTLGTESLEMSVILSYEKFNNIFTYILSVFIFIVYVNMGATIDLKVVRQIVKRPVGPVVGVFCQYGFMPVIAFCLAKVTFPENTYQQLGMFLTGASPGGGSSNMWTYLLGGSLDLSIMMTFVSTIVAFAAVPLWVLLLGPKITGDDAEFVIPYDKIATIVVSLVVPCTIGLLLQRFLPKVAKFLENHVLGPFAVFNIIFILTVGASSHRYIFELFTWKILLAGFALPVLGYIAGFILAYVTRRTWSQIIAISIETGVQNATIAIMILKFTLGRPAGDLAVVIPACSVIMTPFPLLVALIIKIIIQRFTMFGGSDLPTVKESTKESFENRAMSYSSSDLPSGTNVEKLSSPPEKASNGVIKLSDYNERF